MTTVCTSTPQQVFCMLSWHPMASSVPERISFSNSLKGIFLIFGCATNGEGWCSTKTYCCDLISPFSSTCHSFGSLSEGPQNIYKQVVSKVQYACFCAERTNLCMNRSPIVSFIIGRNR
eukprot:6472451-Amphidinium_carterae.1